MALYIPEIPRPTSRMDELRDMTRKVQELLKQKNFNPVEEMVDLAIGLKQSLPNMKVDEAVEASTLLAYEKLNLEVLKELASYVAPKLKSVDISGSVDTGITVIVGMDKVEEKRVHEATAMQLPNIESRIKLDDIVVKEEVDAV